MNEPKRLLAESQSSLTQELLLAARGEHISDELRLRMADGLAVTIGATSIGAGLTLGTQSAVAGLETSALGSAGGVAASVSSAPGALVLGSGALASSGSAVTASAGGALWLKGVLAMSVLTGAVGLGSAVTHWVSPGAGAPPSPLEAASSFAVAPADTPAVVQGTAVQGTAVQGTAVQGTAVQGTAVQGTAVSPVGELAVPRAGFSDDEASAAGANDAERSARRSRPKTRAADAVAASGDLDREVRLLDAARRAILAGDITGAREKLAQYSRAFPHGALRGEAASLAKAAANAE